MACIHVPEGRGYQGSEWHGLEQQQKAVVDVHTVLCFTLLLEAEVPGDAGTLVIPAEHPYILRVFDLQGQEIQHDLAGIIAAIDVIAQEEKDIVADFVHFCVSKIRLSLLFRISTFR